MTETMSEMVRLDLPDPDDAHSLDWFPEPSMEPRGLPGVLTETSYQLPENLNLGEWLAIGETLQRMERSVMWWLGDWWNYGERKYGEMASQASRDTLKDKTGHSYQTLVNASVVSKRFENNRRRLDVPFAYHEAVVTLPAPDADALLDEAEEKGWKRAEIREQAKERKQIISVEAALAQPAPSPLAVPPSVRIEQADARSLPLDDESVHLVVTSPPYGVGKLYEAGGDESPEAWAALIYGACREMLRVCVPSGRLALNVPLDTTVGGFQPVYSVAVQMVQAAGWRYRSSIVWLDDQLGKSVARGSVDSASAPSIIAGVEMVCLFSKGEWRREPPCDSDIRHDEWLEWTNGVWRFPGETQAWEGHPAPYPVRLPYQLVKLLSFPGDVVLDPFCGSGTTALAATTLRREFVGFDRSEQYVASALRRVVRKGQVA